NIRATASVKAEDPFEGLFMSREKFQEIVAAADRKKNMILQGPPGVGKTFVARRVAQVLAGGADPERIAVVQFHQSYSYEDFVQGLRPNHSGCFSLQPGTFFRFCERARATSAPYVLIIDEINRGNLSRIFGEVLTLIEADKRSPSFAVTLAYQREGELFYVPE